MASQIELQNLLFSKSSRIQFQKIPLSGKYGKIYRTINLDGKEVLTFLLCIKCKKFLKKDKHHSGNFVRHYNLHQMAEHSDKYHSQFKDAELASGKMV